MAFSIGLDASQLMFRKFIVPSHTTASRVTSSPRTVSVLVRLEMPPLEDERTLPRVSHLGPA